MPEQKVRHVLFYVPLRPGNLMLAEMDDGSLCILRDDEPLQACWEHGEMTKALAEFERMRAELAPKKR